jgi:hypothetical protein
MSQAAKLKRATEKAREYVAKIGRLQHHFGSGSVGDLRSVEVITQIHHQESAGSTNYWKDADFDDALARVLKRRFAELADEALDLMQADYAQARIAEKASLLAQLAEIEALEITQPGAA